MSAESMTPKAEVQRGSPCQKNYRTRVAGLLSGVALVLGVNVFQAFADQMAERERFNEAEKDRAELIERQREEVLARTMLSEPAEANGGPVINKNFGKPLIRVNK